MVCGQLFKSFDVLKNLTVAKNYFIRSCSCL